MSIELHTYDYLMNVTLVRVTSGKLYDRNLKPYTLKFLNEVLSYFEDKEEYEKCKTLSEIVNKRSHDHGYTNR